MKSAVAIPVISFLSLTSTVSAAPKSTAAVAATGLSDQQWSAIKDYQHAQATKSEFSSVNRVLATADIPVATKVKEESEFRSKALETAKPELPEYLKDTNPKASAYLSSYYLAQASIINKMVDKKDVQTDSDVAQLLPDITSPSAPTKTPAKTTETNKSDKPTSTGTKKPSSTKKASSTPKATKGQDPAVALESSSTGSGSSTSTGVKPLETTGRPKESTTKKDLKSTGTGTASSSGSTGAAAMAQPTGVMKMAGLGMLGVAGVAAFL